MRYLFLLTLMSLFAACNSPQNEVSETEESEETTEQKDDANTESTVDLRSWDDFWSQFQKAVLAGDKTTVKKLTHFGAITEKEIDDMYEGFFGGDYTAYFEKATAADAKADESTFDGVEVTDLMRFEIYESGEDEEGNEYESGISYYFGKIDGAYYLVYIVAAG
jgi:hypothetical protein